MKKHFLLFILLSFSVLSFSQKQDWTAIDSIFADWNKPDAPGCALGIVQDGKLVYSNGYGSGDLEHDLPLTPSSVFYIGSVSKQFVTFCVLLLEEQGKLNLDDPIQKYLPDFPEYEAPLTIRHFIHHTSGVRDYLTLMFLKGRSYLDNIDPEEVYELIKQQKELNFSPGEQYLYSNSCYFMLAMIVEKAAGKSIRDFAQEEVFGPLGMNSTLFYDDNRDLIKNRVFSYEKKEDEEGFNNLILRFDLVGSGGVYSSIEDLFLWDQNFYDNKLGKGGPAIIEKMHEEGLLNNGESCGYAFALNNGTYKGLKTVSHGGALAGYRAQLMRFPDQNFSVIVLANRDDANPTGRCYAVADILLKDEFKPEPEEEEEEMEETTIITETVQYSMEQLPGMYEIEPGFGIEFSIKDDSLNAVQSWNKVSYSVVNTKDNIYQIPGETSISFIFSDLKDDFAQTLTILQGGDKTVCTRKEKIDLSKINLEDYTGTFYSKEIDADYRISLEGESLQVKVPNTSPFDIELSDETLFTSQRGLFRFEKKDGMVVGFELDAGRVENLKFERL